MVQLRLPEAVPEAAAVPVEVDVSLSEAELPAQVEALPVPAAALPVPPAIADCCCLDCLGLPLYRLGLYRRGGRGGHDV